MNGYEYIKQLENKVVELEKRIETLEKHIEKLERLLDMNSKNSSKPPSSDPPNMPAILSKQRRKKRGAKNGHQPHMRLHLSQEFVKKHIHLKPDAIQPIKL